MIMCPKCGEDAQVYSGHPDPEDQMYIRRRKCGNCGYRFITVEVISNTAIQGDGKHGGARARRPLNVPEGAENVCIKQITGKTLRPCETDGGKAYFHKWVQGVKSGNTFALIEYLDGTIDMVNPETVRFLDR